MTNESFAELRDFQRQHREAREMGQASRAVELEHTINEILRSFLTGSLAQANINPTIPNLGVAIRDLDYLLTFGIMNELTRRQLATMRTALNRQLDARIAAEPIFLVINFSRRGNRRLQPRGSLRMPLRCH